MPGLHCCTRAFFSCGKWRRLSSCGVWISYCGGFSCCMGPRASGLQWLRHAGSVVAAHGLWSVGSVVVAHGLSCPEICGIFLDRGSNPCLLHWQVDSLPLSHQGSPIVISVLSCFLSFNSFIYLDLSCMVILNSVFAECNT